MNLYELTGAYARIQELAEQGEDVQTELALIEGSILEKSTRIVYVLKNLEADAEAIGAEAKRLYARKKAVEANIDRLKAYVKGAMTNAGASKLRAGALSISVYDGPEHVVVDDEAAIPDTYQRIKKEPNRTAILDAYKTTGECVPGTRIERSVCLRIR